MGSFHDFIKSLCVGGQWSYAVFWKIDCLNSGILIWEDCFWDSSDNIGMLMQYIFNNFRFHVVGQGLVGRAALTGNHEWILFDQITRIEYANELHIQYSAGVKTVVVVAHPTIGSVLLGSRFPIAENELFVNNIRSMLPSNQPSELKQFNALECIYEGSLSSQRCSYSTPVDPRAQNTSSEVKYGTADDLYNLVGFPLAHSIDDTTSCVSWPTLNHNAQDNLLDAVVTKASHSNATKVEMESCSSTPSSALTSWVRQDPSSVVLGPKCEEPRKTPRKRENPRPRPKDRQMIQDRVKELREIVPNGVKCSIDALLEKTIKHMLFLQSVTKHAEKLKLPADSKPANDLGKTWAYEVGSLSTFCPIVVQDMNTPRLLFVEMVCEERGFFLEIADVIRGMGLTIMKGTMECRDGKILAQFAVEADRDVTRRQVFMSLVHLLEEMKCKAMETDIGSHSTLFFPSTSIPATGGDTLFR